MENVITTTPFTNTSNDPYENRKTVLNDLPITDKMNLDSKESYINLGRDKFKSRYHLVCFDIESQEEINRVCDNYIIWYKNGYFTITSKGVLRGIG